MKTINCFISYSNNEITQKNIQSLQASSFVNTIYLLYTDKEPIFENCISIKIDSLQASKTVLSIAEHANTPYSLIYTKQEELSLGQFALERFQQIAQDTNAAMVYSDFYQVIDGVRKATPTIDYQEGSIRDDFNFGSVLFYNSEILRKASESMEESYHFAGLYDLRLRSSIIGEIFHLNEFLYTELEDDNRKSGEKQFDYVDPKNRNVQIEMEDTCTSYLKKIGAFLRPHFKSIQFDNSNFTKEASVIIPVKDRSKTIEDAIQSVLNQETSFDFNLIIVDNHSTDGTTEIIEKYAADDNRIVHIIPNRTDLGIGGCWNEGVQSPYCGRFSVQLDSDDVYSSPKTLETIIDCFYKENCAMVIGSYTMTNFDMEMIAPGLIDHKEWTPENGRNNALRINGLGAPRAFYTPILREIKVPNTSYGEDYALGLRISREYQIGRIYDSVYLCRRWDENSDASLDIQKQNNYNSYKDKLRSMEIKARKNLSKK